MKKSKKLIAVCFGILLTLSIITSSGRPLGGYIFAEDLADLQAKQQALNADIAANEKKLQELGESAKETEEYIAIYDQKMADQEALVESLNEQAGDFEDRAQVVSDDISDTELQIADGIESFRKRLRAMYMSQSDSIASVLAGSRSFYDILVSMEFIERVSKRDDALINGLNERVSELNVKKTELESIRVELENTLAEANLEHQRLRQTYASHSETLAAQNEMIADYTANAAELEKQAEKAEAEIEAFIKAEQERLERERQARIAEEARKKAEAEAAGKNYSEDKTGTYTSYSQTGFIWPVPSVHNQSDGYGNRWIVEEQQSDFHKGIDITKPGCVGSEIVASAGGTVIQASNSYNGYGICVILDHGNTMSTLYAHMQETVVSVGQVVSQGQTLGYIGHTGNAYGNHLHFEVRKNGQHTDPSQYVSY
jgi:murein DD-endopeptidase MepM/ murein hydrolase activator NlpD